MNATTASVNVAVAKKVGHGHRRDRVHVSCCAVLCRAACAEQVWVGVAAMAMHVRVRVRVWCGVVVYRRLGGTSTPAKGPWRSCPSLASVLVLSCRRCLCRFTAHACGTLRVQALGMFATRTCQPSPRLVAHASPHDHEFEYEPLA